MEGVVSDLNEIIDNLILNFKGGVTEDNLTDAVKKNLLSVESLFHEITKEPILSSFCRAYMP